MTDLSQRIFLMRNKILILLVLLGLGYLGYKYYQRLAPPPEPPAPVATPTPTPTSTPAHEPAPEARLAPEGVLYVVKRFSEPHDGGVRGFSPGTEVRLLREEAGYFVVTDGKTEARRPRSWFTRDIQLAEELRAQKVLTDQQISERQAREKEAHENATRLRTARREPALAPAEADRQVAGKSTQAAATTRPELKSLRLGSWNLEHFGSRNDPPRTDGDVQAIADYIRNLDVQVLAVCEINGEQPLKQLVERIGPDWKFILGTSGKVGQEGQVAPGVLWDNAKVEMLGAGELSELSEHGSAGLVFHRAPVVAAFRDRAGGPDFRVVSVHLKAGRTPEDVDRRTAEGRSLRAYLEKLISDQSQDDDIVVLGVFNHDPSAREGDAWTDGGFAQLLRGRGRSIIHFDRQIDQVAPLGTFEEIRVGSFEIHNRQGLGNAKKWRNTYSDHFPVTVRLEAVADDDPTAKLSVLGKRLK